MKGLRVVGWLLLSLIVILALGPFLVPVRPLQDTHSAQALAGPDSQFIVVNGIEVHYRRAGQGEPYLILLHGFGSSTYTWEKVIPRLSEIGTVIAYDRPAFGLTSRPMQWQGENPYGMQAQVDLLFSMMDQMGIQKAVLIGNSAGGGVAALAALQQPNRVQALVLVDPAIGTGGISSPLLRMVINTPQMDHLGPLISRQLESRGDELIRTAWHDPSKITPEDYAAYHLPLRAENWDRALWNLTKAPVVNSLRDQVSSLSVPVLILTGDDDRIVPTAQTVNLAAEMPEAKLVILKACGHVPQEECPQDFLNALIPYLPKK